MTYLELKSILAEMKGFDREFEISGLVDGYLIRVVYDEPDVLTGKIEAQHGRWWVVPSDASETDVVDTAFAAVSRSYMHALQEHFLASRRVSGWQKADEVTISARPGQVRLGMASRGKARQGR